MRIHNSLMNMFFGLSGQVISIVMGFIVRTIFIHILGIAYLGVDGLFSSILIMLSLANLGFDTAMTYSLYKPLADNDTYKIQALMNLYQKAYRVVSLVILLIGLSLLPFLPYVMNGDTTIKHINVIYLLFLINSVFSYFSIYKQSIIIADQRNHIISKIHSVFTVITNCFQIILLITISNFIVVLSVQIAFRLIENIYISRKADKLYGYLKEKNSAKLSKEDRKNFFENLYSLMLYKISAVVINGTDNIVISKFVGITWVGIYSNYLLIMNTISTFLGYIFYSITASIGNLNVNESKEKKYFIFQVLNFSNFWIFGFCTVSLWSLINPLISIWLGDKYLFDKYIVFVIILNFFTAGMQNASTTFRDTTGLFKKGKYRPLIAAVINIVASIILVRMIGIAGVFLGTVISRLCTYFWYDPYVIYKFVFQKSVKTYFLRYLWFGLMVILSAFITDTLGNMLFPLKLFINFGIRVGLCLIIPNVFFYIVFRNSEEFKYLWNVARSFNKKIPLKVLGRRASNV